MKTTLSVYFILFYLIFSPLLFPQSKKDGWEDGSKFNNLYNTGTVDTIIGEVTQVDDISPMKGMEPGIRVLVKIKNEIIPAYIAPIWLTKYLNLTIRPQDQIEISGSHVQLEGKNIILASRVVSNGIILQLRDNKGHPVWDCMRPI